MQETGVQCQIREDPIFYEAPNSVCHNYWAYAWEPGSRNCWAHVAQLLKPVQPKACALQQDKPLQEEACTCNSRVTSVLHNLRKACTAGNPAQPKINKLTDNYIERLFYMKVKCKLDKVSIFLAPSALGSIWKGAVHLCCRGTASRRWGKSLSLPISLFW